MNIDLPRSFYTWGWAGWILYFVVLEGLAVLDDDPGETLSAHVVWVRNNIGSFAWFMIAGVLLWLLYHFLVERRVFT